MFTEPNEIAPHLPLTKSLNHKLIISTSKAASDVESVNSSKENITVNQCDLKSTSDSDSEKASNETEINSVT